MKAFLCIAALLIVGLTGVALCLHFRAKAAENGAQDAAAFELAQKQTEDALAIKEPDPPHPPGYNFALASHGAKITGGIKPELLIDGNSTTYDSGNGYGYTHWRNKPTESFVIEL